LPPTVSDNFTSISASFTVPTVTPSVGDSYSGVWVGLDGIQDNTVEQIGILANYISGAPQYTAFYELFPNDTVLLNFANGFNFVTRPGDSITASVLFNGVVNGVDSYTFDILNNTRNRHVTVTDSPGGFNPVAPRSSAEFIVEDPSLLLTGLAPLNQIGSVTFTNAQATLDGNLTGPITTFPFTRIEMVQNATTLAHTSSLDPTGSSFTVTIPEPSLLSASAFALVIFSRRRRR